MTACELIFPLFSRSGWVATCQETGWVALLASWGAVALLAGIVLIGGYHLVRRIQMERSTRLWRLVASFSALIAALLLAVAAGRPAYLHAPSERQQHFILLVDQSESAHRQPTMRRDQIGALAKKLATLASDDANARTRVSLIDFAASVDVKLNRGSLSDGLALLQEDDVSNGLSHDGSDLASALDAAKALADQQRDDDVLFLLSDGNATTAPLAKLASRLKGRLGPVFISSLDAGAASEGIISSYLPAKIRSGSKPTLRLVFDPGAAEAKDVNEERWTVTLRRDGAPEALENDRLDGGHALQALRIPMRFEGRGLQFASVDVKRREQTFSERVFTLVDAPIRVLGLGATGFLNALPQDKFELEQRRAADLSRLDDFDIVVLGGMDAAQFQTGDLVRLADAVKSRVLGLFLVNGPLGGSAEDPTVVQSYAHTALDPLLPVSPDPKYLQDDPPPRDTIVLVDTSGSMAGGGLAAARLAVADILDYLRPQDSLELITFGGLTTGRQMGDARGKKVIRNFASRFPTGDSSNVSRAFERALASTGNYTSVFLITDGMVDPYDYAKAGLSFYYLQYGSGATPLNEEIAQAARQSQILQSGQGLSFKPDSYDPEERAEFFTPDLVRPRIVTPIDGISGGLATPGVAFTYAKADAVRALVSDGLEGEPVLAFHKADQLEKGNTGVFLSALDGAWTDSAAGRRTIETSLTQLVKWSNRNRYSFRLQDFGDEITLRVSVVGEAADAPLPQTLSATLLLAGQSIGVPMTMVKGEQGVFEGRFALPSHDAASEGEGAVNKGLLYLQEGGAGALEQPQAIPVTLPYAVPRAGNRSEAASYGVDLSGLQALADATGGTLDHLPNHSGQARQFSVPPKPVHRLLLLLATVFFGLSFLMRGSRL
ncbi:von Willebrand factor type A domain-containing protein [Cohaesibacter marisflavi]|uniref:von Willebrand factor type A domain-containing protein n=1 Tax=Cohaesibacter marisflavi TaxID=655353 RepID=A0A1I5KNL6_9HYPH|nr:VWA domain-containing protein [Cohaesibacter marisflavi]SFO86507.1 von Willebrand factor type A domain-containing protein [Cohaesibacter marisflavi]